MFFKKMCIPLNDEFTKAKERAQQQKILKRITVHNMCNGRKFCSVLFGTKFCSKIYFVIMSSRNCAISISLKHVLRLKG